MYVLSLSCSSSFILSSFKSLLIYIQGHRISFSNGHIQNLMNALETELALYEEGKEGMSLFILLSINLVFYPSLSLSFLFVFHLTVINHFFQR